jgi:hypothetical protein
MTNFARIINGVAVDVSSNPTEQFHPDIAKDFVPVTDQVESGWSVSAGKWIPPAPVEPITPAAVYSKVGPIAFQMLFKVDELVAIDAAKETNPAIRIFWKLLDDPRTDYVDRNLEPVQTMLRSLEAGGLLAAGRAEEILHGSVA